MENLGFLVNRRQRSRGRGPCPVLSLILTLTLLMTAVGCMNKGPRVELIPDTVAPMTCSQALEADISHTSDDELFRLLNQSREDEWMETCWQPLVVKALEGGRDIPMSHLTLALHRFNRRDTVREFHLVSFRYFSRIIKGDARYGEHQKALLRQYLHLSIQDAAHKNDPNLKQAMVVASRLDPDIYGKFFN